MDNSTDEGRSPGLPKEPRLNTKPTQSRILGWLREHLPSAILGAIVGAIIGYAVAQVQTHYSEAAKHKQELTARIEATLREVKLNNRLRTNPPAYREKGDSVAIKRCYSVHALEALTNELPKLLPADTFIYNNTALMLEYGYTLNQIIRQRNLVRSETSDRDNQFGFLDSVMNVLLGVNDTLAGWYVDSLRARIP